MATGEIKKTKLGLIIIGHVDSGKSTTTGNLMFENGGIDKRQMSKIEKKANECGRPSFKFAFILDSRNAERSRGITIDAKVKSLESKNFHLTLIDAPGHRDFIKNMISGSCSADAALLIVDSTPGGFEAGISPRGQTRQHLLLAYASGVKNLIVAVNKIDALPKEDQEDRFNTIKSEIGLIAKKIGFLKSVNHCPFIPISGLKGYNLTCPDTCFPWHPKFEYTCIREDGSEVKKTGVTLMDAIDSLEPPVPVTEYPLRGCVTDSFEMKGIGIIATVSINYGIARVGMNLRLEPCGQNTVIRTMEMHKQPYNELEATCCAGMNLKNMQLKDLKRGTLLGETTNPPYKVIIFEAKLVAFLIKRIVKCGFTPVVDTNTAHVPCTLIEIKDVKKSKRHMSLVAEVGEDVDFVATGDKFLGVFRPKSHFCVEALPSFPRYTRIIIRDSHVVVAAGSCVRREIDEVVDKQQKAALEKVAKAAKR